MFPKTFFPKLYFAGKFWPPVDDGVTPPVPAIRHYPYDYGGAFLPSGVDYRPYGK